MWEVNHLETGVNVVFIFLSSSFIVKVYYYNRGK